MNDDDYNWPAIGEAPTELSAPPVSKPIYSRTQFDEIDGTPYPS